MVSFLVRETCLVRNRPHDRNFPHTPCLPWGGGFTSRHTYMTVNSTNKPPVCFTTVPHEKKKNEQKPYKNAAIPTMSTQTMSAPTSAKPSAPSKAQLRYAIFEYLQSVIKSGNLSEEQMESLEVASNTMPCGDLWVLGRPAKCLAARAVNKAAHVARHFSYWRASAIRVCQG
jgi:hypothetical protein